MDKIVDVIPATNKHSKAITFVECNCSFTCGNILVCCPSCGAALCELDEPHHNKNIWCEAVQDKLSEKWNSCPWPHPHYFEDEIHEFVGPEKHLNFMYEDNHPYWLWMEEYDKLGQKYMCDGPKFSKECQKFIGIAGAPEEHQACDEECYCNCHYALCICTDAYKEVNKTRTEIICYVHGHVYSSILN